MNITKDPKVISEIHVQRGTKHILKFGVGPAPGEVEGDITYDGMISAIEKGQKYQVHAYGSGDPANVTVKDTDEGKVLTTGRDGNELNNLIGNTDLKTIEVGRDSTEEESQEEQDSETEQGTESSENKG